LIFLSSAFLQQNLAPQWIQDIARYNPANWAIEAGRTALSSNATAHTVLTHTLYLLVFAVVCTWLATRAFRSYQRSVRRESSTPLTSSAGSCRAGLRSVLPRPTAGLAKLPVPQGEAATASATADGVVAGAQGREDATVVTVAQGGDGGHKTLSPAHIGLDAEPSSWRWRRVRPWSCRAGCKWAELCQ